MKKITIPNELAYLISIIAMSFAVAMVSAADLGLSMIVAPAYILSQALGVVTFGQSEYIVQALLLVVFCILVRRVRLTYLVSFATCLIYGAFLDLWRQIIPLFNPAITPPGSMGWPLRIALFTVGSLITAFGVALSFRPYLYAQMYDFFVKGVSAYRKVDRTRIKMIFDFSFLALALIMTLVLFGKFVGIGVATVILALVNGPVIGLFDRLLGKYVVFPSLFPKWERYFD